MEKHFVSGVEGPHVSFPPGSAGNQADGRPAGGDGALFHPKVGILIDESEDMICFQGSVNETGAAWARNREKFQVARSWYSEQDREDIKVESEEFERLWHNREPGLLVVFLPEAARVRLLRYLPDGPPTVDVMDPDFGRTPLSIRIQAEVFDPARNQWVVVEKVVVKERARRDHPRAVKVLLCTDAASEGINLQQFTALVNYDLPWNPMRVEQRIGRIDRIGQEAPEVRVVNLYVSGTIEHDAYRVLGTRIGFFHRVVGPLQPILATMPRIMRMVATGELERAEALKMIAEAAGEELDAGMQPLEKFLDPGEPGEAGTSVSAQEAPVTQAELAAWCLKNRPAGMRLTLCPEPGQGTLAPDPAQGCFVLRWVGAPEYMGISPEGEVLVTFNPDVADRHPPTALQSDTGGSNPPRGLEGVRYLTWGEPLLEAWLAAVRGDELANEELRQLGIRIEREQEENWVRLRWRHDSGPIKTFTDLLRISGLFTKS